MKSNNYLLWDNDEFSIKTPDNPHLPYSEGLHIMLAPKAKLENAWENPEITGKVFELAAKACKLIEELELSPWFNIQANGNWGLLPEGRKFFHVHIYGRNKTDNWGKPINLPELPEIYHNEPMPEADRIKISEAFKSLN
jgi:diadenosine tetraphosphate (Ap4A) HIT family hydrolase